MNLDRHSGTPKARQACLFVCRPSASGASQSLPPGAWVVVEVEP